MSHCATSLDEFTIGQHVRVVVGMGCTKPGVVADIGPNKVDVQFDDGTSGLYRPYEVIPGSLPVAPARTQLTMRGPIGDCRGYGPTGWCKTGRHHRCAHRVGGPADGGVVTAECYVTMPNRCPGRTDDFEWIVRLPNGRDVAVVEPHHVYRCPCECHTAPLVGQLDLFEVTSC